MSQIPFSPPQAQAAIQNPVRFPDQKLQQYASGQPPQPTGQVTQQMAGNELAVRNAQRQAASRQQAMNNNPENSPTIFQQLMMKEQMVDQQAQAIQQQAQAIQQKEQQLGLAGAMITKKARDLAERERGIAQLPVRPDMFTAMDGGIVFNGGGKIERYASDGYVMNRDLTDEERRALQDYAGRLQNSMLGVQSGFPRVSTIESAAPSTVTATKDTGTKPPSTTSEKATPAASTPKPTSADEALAKLEQYFKRSDEEALYERKLSEMWGELVKEIRAGRITEEQAKVIMDAKIKQRQDIYGEYTKDRTGRQKKMEDALRGKAPDLTDFLLAVSAGGPGKTFAETLSRMVPGATKLRAEQQAREMAAAKFAAEADELNAKADMLQKMGDIDAAERARADAEKRKADELKLKSDATTAASQGIVPLLQGARYERLAKGEAATGLMRDQLKDEAALRRMREEMGLRGGLQQTPVDRLLYDDLSSTDPERVAKAKAFIAAKAGTRGQLSEAKIAELAATFNDPFKGEELRKKYGTLERYIAAVRALHSGESAPAETSGKVRYDIQGNRIQ
jgi:hypothetical protein